jgi:hypothetical protein
LVLGNDTRHQAFERLIPSIFAGVDFAVLLHDPAQVAGSQLTQHNRWCYRRRSDRRGLLETMATTGLGTGIASFLKLTAG